MSLHKLRRLVITVKPGSDYSVSVGQPDQTASDRLNLIDRCLRDTKRAMSHIVIKKTLFLVSVKTELWTDEREEIYAAREEDGWNKDRKMAAWERE